MQLTTGLLGVQRYRVVVLHDPPTHFMFQKQNWLKANRNLPWRGNFMYKKFWLTVIFLTMRLVTLQQHICTSMKMNKNIILQNREAFGRVAPELLLLSIRRVPASRKPHSEIVHNAHDIHWLSAMPMTSSDCPQWPWHPNCPECPNVNWPKIVRNCGSTAGCFGAPWGARPDARDRLVCQHL